MLGALVDQLYFSQQITVGFEQTIQSLSIDSGYVELFDIDLQVIGSSQVLHYVPDNYTSSDIIWQGITYTPVPIDISGFEWNGTSSSPPSPIMTISNVAGLMMQFITQNNDIVGAKITRTRTFKKYLDGQPYADPTASFPRDVYLVSQKNSHTKTQIEWGLISVLDRPDVQLPYWQMLKDKGFPGLSRVRNPHG
jgi:lambda family phage minor tail protein L